MLMLLAGCSRTEGVRLRWQKMNDSFVIGTQGAVECNVRKREGKGALLEHFIIFKILFIFIQRSFIRFSAF